MELIAKEALPIKTFAYIERHFAYVADVQGKNGPQRQRKMRRKLGQMFLVLTLQSFQFALVYTLYKLKLLNPVELIILGQYVELSCLRRETYFPMIGILLLSGYYLRLLYFDRSHGIERLLGRILLERKWAPAFMNGQKGQGGQPVCEYLKQYTMAIITSFQVFFLVIGKLILLLL